MLFYSVAALIIYNQIYIIVELCDTKYINACVVKQHRHLKQVDFSLSMCSQNYPWKRRRYSSMRDAAKCQTYTTKS